MDQGPPPRGSPALEWLPHAWPSPDTPICPLQVQQAARDGGSGGGASGAGLKVDGRRRPASQPHDSDTEEDGEWEPGAVSWKFGGHCTALGSKEGFRQGGSASGAWVKPADPSRPRPPPATSTICDGTGPAARCCSTAWLTCRRSARCTAHQPG